IFGRLRLLKFVNRAIQASSDAKSLGTYIALIRISEAQPVREVGISMRPRSYLYKSTLRALALFVSTLTCIIVTANVIPPFGQRYSVTNIFRPLAQPAQEISETSILVLAICGVIFTVVAGLLFYTIIRYRHRKGEERGSALKFF